MTKKLELTEDEVRALLAAAVEAAGGQRSWAARAEVSQTYVSQVISGQRDPGQAITKALGLRRVVRYEDAWDHREKDKGQ